ncbi:capsular polysaccharide biosynthesis protein CapF [Limnobacter sp.]|uniref:UDP-2-acetamido-2,6-beta-L-arabino-hexul-4-ose reductase n=1 Tax=Limnobacter sp. TaxID=2003368 RepID=UPI00311FBF1F
MKILITGSKGFIGKNLLLHLAERKDIEVICFTRSDSSADLPRILNQVNFVFHLAGINRPKDPADFTAGNSNLTRELCTAIKNTGRHIPVVYTSSTQASQNSPYGVSKRAAEDALFELREHASNPVYVFRLPNVFGKWCKPNYNSAVATFCHNIARDLPIQVNDPNAELTLVYVDDVITRFLQLMDGANPAPNADGFDTVTPQYKITVGQVAELLHTFRNSRNTLITAPVGTGLVRALYSTYVSHLPPELFSYAVPKYGDPRGVFVEMLKTPDSGQFSYFTAHPGITRGGHYHHSKTEKFLVIKGQACFKFRHMHTHETHELVTNGEHPEIVETVPGWTHDITNIGEDEMVVMLWANEIFDRSKPDTFACPL